MRRSILVVLLPMPEFDEELHLDREILDGILDLIEKFWTVF
jgi:hypothetical protein